MTKPSLLYIKQQSEILFGCTVWCKTRKRAVVRNRQISHYVAHTIYNYPTEAIAFHFGHLKQHATVLHSCKTIAGELERYPLIKKKVKRLIRACKKGKTGTAKEQFLKELLKSKALDVNVKIEVRRILKMV